MGTSLRNPGQIVGLSCDSANVAALAVLVQGASNDSVKLPSGAGSRERFIGVAYEAGATSANKPISIVINGIMPMLASGAVTRGDALVIASAAGAVASVTSTTAPDATRVGIALESVADGEYVAALIGHTGGMTRGTVIPMTANGAITANTIVIAAAGSTAAAPGGADVTSGVLGVALNTVADTETVYVQTSGIALVTDNGAGVSVKDFIAVAGTNGKGKTAAPAGGTNNHVVGVALATTSASGSIPVMVQPQRIQG